MYSRAHSSRRFWTARGAALAGIIVLHVAALAAALSMRGPQADVEPESSPIQVVMLLAPERARPPDAAVKPPEVTVPQIVLPVVSIDLPAPPPTITVAAVVTPVPQPAPTAPATTGDSESPVSIAQADWVRMPSPVYPAAAKQARAQGVVHVRALVDGNGQAQSALVHRSSGFATLDRAACDSVLAALFRPYLHNGVPRSVDVIVPITFALTMRGGGGRGPPRREQDRDELQLDVRREDHHAMRRHPEELGRLGATALHVREQPELEVGEE